MSLKVFHRSKYSQIANAARGSTLDPAVEAYSAHRRHVYVYVMHLFVQHKKRHSTQPNPSIVTLRIVDADVAALAQFPVGSYEWLCSGMCTCSAHSAPVT